MFQIFTSLADWAVLKMGLDTSTHFGQAVHFFIEDITKIFALIYVLIFVISLFRGQLSAEKVRDYLSGKNRWYGYFLAVFLGGLLRLFVLALPFRFLSGLLQRGYRLALPWRFWWPPL